MECIALHSRVVENDICVKCYVHEQLSMQETRCFFKERKSQRVTSSKISPDVYHLVNTMRHFIVSVSYPVKNGRGLNPSATDLGLTLDRSPAARA
jgi:hypothetical protein